MLLFTNILRLIPRSCINPTRILSTAIDPINMAFDVEVPPNKVGNKPILILHGLLGSKRNWKTISKGLAATLGQKVYSLDARNHGDSPHVAEHSEMHIAEDIAHFIKNQNLESVQTIGHSMGGRAMMYFALKYPNLCDRSIVVDISPVSLPRDIGSMSNLFNTMKNMQIPDDSSLSEGRKLMRKQFMEVLDASDMGNIDFILMNLRKKSDTGEFCWAVNVDVLMQTMLNGANYVDQIRNIEPFLGNVLFVCGSKSPFFKSTDMDDVRQIFPNSNLEWLDAGHLVHIEKPKEFLQLTVDFFSGN